MSQRNTESAAIDPESTADDGRDADDPGVVGPDQRARADEPLAEQGPAADDAVDARAGVGSGPRRDPRGSSAVLPESSERESSRSWGDDSGGFDDDWYLSERPPHHG